MPRSGVQSVRDMNIMIISAPRRVNMLELRLLMTLMTRRLLRMSTFLLRLLVWSTSIDSDIPIIEGHASYEDTSEVVYAIVESSTPLDVDARAHDISESAAKLAKSRVSSY